MGLFNKKAKNYYIKYFPGGGSHGITSTYVDELIEDFTGLPLHKTFNMFAGSSIGSINASALNTPENTTRSAENAKYNSRSFRYALMRVMDRALPYKSFFYPRQILIGVPNLLYQGFAESQRFLSRETDKVLNRSLQYLQKQKFWPFERKIGYIRPFSRLHDKLAKPINDFMIRVFEPVVKSTFYDIDGLHKEMEKELESIDTQQAPKLQDTLISHHSIAFNVTRNQPAYFVHIKDPETNETLHISDEELPLHDMCCRSSAAQTIFQHFKDENGEYYADSADTDTVKTSATTVRRTFGSEYQPVAISIGTGYKTRGFKFDLHSVFYTILGQLLHIRPFATAHNVGKEMKDLALEIGKENIFEINRSREAEVQAQKYDEIKKNGQLRPLLRIFGAEAIRESYHNEVENCPDSLFLIDSREKSFRVLNRFGYAMAWEHALEIAELSKDLLHNAAAYGHITKSEAESRIQAISALFNDNALIEINAIKDMRQNAANDEFSRIKTEKTVSGNFKAYKEEMYKKWPFLQDLKKLFKETATKPEDYEKTPFVPLRFGSALSLPGDPESRQKSSEISNARTDISDSAPSHRVA